MTMRQKIARALRKWADLIDPRTPPRVRRESLTIKIGLEGVEEFEAKVAKLRGECEALARLSAGMQLPSPSIHWGSTSRREIEDIMAAAFERARAGGSR